MEEMNQSINQLFGENSEIKWQIRKNSENSIEHSGGSKIRSSQIEMGLKVPASSTNNDGLEPRGAKLTDQQETPEAHAGQSKINFLVYNWTADIENVSIEDFKKVAAIACSKELAKCKNNSERNLTLAKYCVAEMRNFVAEMRNFVKGEGTYSHPKESTATFAKKTKLKVNGLYKLIDSLLAGVDDSKEKNDLSCLMWDLYDLYYKFYARLKLETYAAILA
jgi:hypothetical protein